MCLAWLILERNQDKQQYATLKGERRPTPNENFSILVIVAAKSLKKRNILAEFNIKIVSTQS
jgi:hypothetical protein